MILTYSAMNVWMSFSKVMICSSVSLSFYSFCDSDPFSLICPLSSPVSEEADAVVTLFITFAAQASISSSLLWLTDLSSLVSSGSMKFSALSSDEVFYCSGTVHLYLLLGAFSLTPLTVGWKSTMKEIELYILLTVWSILSRWSINSLPASANTNIFCWRSKIWKSSILVLKNGL